jgi:hypothetical protein
LVFVGFLVFQRFGFFGFRRIFGFSQVRILWFLLDLSFWFFKGSNHSRASTIQRCKALKALHSLFDRGGKSFDFRDFNVDEWKSLWGFLAKAAPDGHFRPKGFYVVE